MCETRSGRQLGTTSVSLITPWYHRHPDSQGQAQSVCLCLHPSELTFFLRPISFPVFWSFTLGGDCTFALLALRCLCHLLTPEQHPKMGCSLVVTDPGVDLGWAVSSNPLTVTSYAPSWTGTAEAERPTLPDSPSIFWVLI